MLVTEELGTKKNWKDLVGKNVAVKEIEHKGCFERERDILSRLPRSEYLVSFRRNGGSLKTRIINSILLWFFCFVFKKGQVLSFRSEREKVLCRNATRT